MTSPDCHRSDNTRATGVPAVVVSGFLGSGKTTLVRHLLRDAQSRGERVAVISNEFGELGIDRALLGEGREAYVELEGGCVCCQLSDELVDTLEWLRREIDPDKVIIETSGVALPYDTQLNFYREPIDTWITDDVAVVVVNAEQLAAGRDLDGTFTDQVTSADLIVLNQLDRVPPTIVDELIAVLREIEPEAPVLRAVRGEVETSVLFPPDPAGVRAERRATGTPRPHTHETFESEELVFAAGVAERDVRAAVAAEGALRAKGFVATADGLRLVQAVGPRIELTEPEHAPDADQVGRIVVIRRKRGASDAHP